ncbi:MAG: N-acetylmuramoyl-L-alanine amidase [Anaerolineae bacterium]|nr:N-acetylmuramoyl-L-alanine amidase [Anaerolineae bacterium]
MAFDWYPQAEKFETTKFYSGNQGRRAVVIHIAQGGFAAAVKWLQDAQMNPNSSAHYVIAKDGRVAQLVSVNDGAWANGLRWNTDATQPNGGYWTNARGVRVTPSWQDIVPGQNPNFYTISIEHEGFYQEEWTPEMYTANNDLLVWIAEQFDLWWKPYRNLIGHYAIDNVDRPNCPGPTVNLETMAADANTARLMKMVVPQARRGHIYGTTALLSLPTRAIITQMRDTDVEIYGYVDYDDKRWYITPFSFNNKLPHFFEAAATAPTADLFPSLSLNPGYRDAVTPGANELRDLAPQWVRVLLFKQYQNFNTGQNTELDWLLERAREANPNIKVAALINPETLGEIPPPTGSANWGAYINTASNLARQIAQFYRGKIHALDVWNEPDVQQILPENYAALLNAAYPKIKSVNPELPVISAGICCGEAFEYLRRVVAAAPDSFDFAGWHLYAERADGYPFADWGFGEIRDSVNQARAIAGKPLWVTEIGAQLDYNWGSIPPPVGVAEYMKRAFAVMSDVGRNQVAQAFWFTWRIEGESWGMVDEGGAKRPAWFTFRELAAGAPPPPTGAVEITNVSLAPATLDVGDVLNVSITVRNGTNAPLPTQAPAPNLVYNEGETFLSRGFAEASGAYRVGIDFQGRPASMIDHPYRWGLGAALGPNESRTITGQIRLSNTAVKNYWAGLVQEKIKWQLDNQGTTQITVRASTPPPPTGKPTILAATFTPINVTTGQMLNVSITVRNDTNVPLATQTPNPNFTYLEGESFLSHGFTEQREALRVGVDFDGRMGIDHPYRWGFGSPLNPGETRVINGAIRLNAQGAKRYWAGLVREQVQWIQDNVGTTSITVSSGTPPPPPSGKPTITNVQFVPTGLEQGQIVQVKITVKNESSQMMTTQGPAAGFLYNEGDNFLTKGFAPINGAWRVGVDYDGRANVDANVFPYRWGLGTTLAPGQSGVIVGFIRLNRRQSVDYWVGLINETNMVVVNRAGVTRLNVIKT